MTFTCNVLLVSISYPKELFLAKIFLSLSQHPNNNPRNEMIVIYKHFHQSISCNLCLGGILLELRWKK